LAGETWLVFILRVSLYTIGLENSSWNAGWGVGCEALLSLLLLLFILLDFYF
jgi:hypothetical protein